MCLKVTFLTAPKVAYVPPQRRAQSEPVVKCTEDQMREWFEKMMMPAMEKRDVIIEQCLDEVKHSPRRDETVVNKLVERLNEQAHDYDRALPKCLKYTVKNKLSYRMFTNLWHRCVEMRNSSHKCYCFLAAAINA